MSVNWKPSKPSFPDFKKEIFEKAGSVSDFIYQIGESPILRDKSVEIPLNKITSRVTKIKIRYLKKCLIRYRKLTGAGRAIAAVQVGIAEKFAAIYTPEKIMIIINPKITKVSEDFLKYPEMCMSAVPVIVPLARPSWIEFDYFDESGNIQKWDTKSDTEQGMILNRVFQHEIDHMEGIVNIDLVKNPKELILHSDPDFYTSAKFEQI